MQRAVRVLLFGLLAIAASTIVDVPSSVAVWSSRSGFVVDETCPLEFLDKFDHRVMGYLRSVCFIECTSGTTPNQQNDVNPFFFRWWLSF